MEKVINDIYNYFLENDFSDKTLKKIKEAVIDDHFNYEMYKESYDAKHYSLGKVVKTNTEYYKLYACARKFIDEYIKKANNPCLIGDLIMVNEELNNNYDDDYAKYYIFRLAVEGLYDDYYMPANEDMIIESRKLLNYFKSINHKKIITGQHTQTIPQEELTHIKKITGFYPKLVGYELLACSLNINPESDRECLEEVEDNKGTLQTALYDNKSILTFTWHMFSPLYGCGKSFYAKNTEFDIRKVVSGDETEEYNAFIKELDHIANLLKHFAEAKKPILFRPFHEADGDWFWWGKYGVEYASEIYKFAYDYLTDEKGLNNLIWVWNSVGAYPGDEYVDIISIDCYGEPKDSKTCYMDKYEELRKKVSDTKLVALAECDVIPDIEELRENKFPFIYYMTWSKEFCLTEKYNSNEKLKEFYKDKDTIKQ